ncbi:hypothetical protein [Mergibacter septicus]|nr:hypothetical protein [Mergibacter septicus]
MDKTSTEKYVVKVINGIPYKIQVHYKNKDETFQGKIKIIINIKF